MVVVDWYTICTLLLVIHVERDSVHFSASFAIRSSMAADWPLTRFHYLQHSVRLSTISDYHIRTLKIQDGR